MHYNYIHQTVGDALTDRHVRLLVLDRSVQVRYERERLAVQAAQGRVALVSAGADTVKHVGSHLRITVQCTQ